MDKVNESGWEKWHDFTAGVMQPVTSWFCEAIEARPGKRTLDAACGTGLPSLAVAQRVGATGQVVALDVSPVMIAAARRKAALAGVTNVEHREMDVAALEFPEASFDAVTCSFGLMFCSDPVKGASELCRVLKPGGRFAVSAWDVPENNHYFRTLFETLGKFVPRPPPSPGAPGPFRLAAPGELARVLEAAGFSDVSVEAREVHVAFDSVSHHWEVAHDMAAPVQAAASALSASELGELKAALAETLAPYMDGERVRIHNTALCASGTR
jgi:SAM-dependent methyltransferase